MACCKHHETIGQCVECEVPQLARNHYFDGKLMIERDFCDEQRYFIGKDRRHNQQLHGSGVVCGLKVKEHPNEACRKQYVVIEPGVAIDCCGSEILVQREEYFDFRAAWLAFFKKQNGENATFDGKTHDFQICVRYRECPTELTPALFNECGCDGTACQPNRVLEGYEFDIIVEPKRTPRDLGGVKLDWVAPKDIVRASQVAEDPKNKKWYVTTSGNPGMLYAYTGDTLKPAFPPVALAAEATDLAASENGALVFVSIKAATPSVRVLDAAKLSDPPVQTLNAPAAGGDLLLARGATEQLYGLHRNAANSAILFWIDPRKNDPPKTVALGEAAEDFAISSDGKLAVVALTSGKIAFVDLTNLAAAPQKFPAGASATSIAIGGFTGALRIFVADKTNVVVLDGAGAKVGSVDMGAGKDVMDVGSSINGDWVFTLTKDGVVQALDTAAVIANLPSLRSSVPVGDAPIEMTLAQSGERLYVTYNGLVADPASGGAAVIDVIDDGCGEILLDLQCPHCSQGDCVVLATIRDFVVDKDLAANARIDNYLDRKILPSTERLTEVILCLLKRAPGNGLQGPPGKDGAPGANGANGINGDPGKPGPGIKEVDAKFVPCDQPGSATLVDEKLLLVIPGSCNPDLTHICGTTWDHDSDNHVQADFTTSMGRGFVISFDKPVRKEDITRHSIQFLTRPISRRDPLDCWCEIVPKAVIPVRLKANPTPRGTCKIDPTTLQPPTAADPFANGALFLLAGPPPLQQEIRAIVKGDFIRSPDKKGKDRAVDANHLPPWLPNRLTGDGIEGGTFESWFSMRD